MQVGVGRMEWLGMEEGLPRREGLGVLKRNANGGLGRDGRGIGEGKV